MKRIVRIACLVAFASTGLATEARAAAPAGFVQASGEGLTVDGSPWRAIGVNLWDMDAAGVLDGDITSCWYTHADLDDYLDRSFAAIRANTGATAVRTFGFRAMYTAGGRDWSTTDKLVHYARKHGIRLIPVFGDQFGTCGTPPKDGTWYRSGHATHVEQPWGVTYRDYVVAAVTRYRDEPTIAFWQLMNEATAGNDTSALLTFSDAMVRAIRTDAGDTNHLINLGTAGAATPGNELPMYAKLLDCPGGCNDLAEAHMYNPSQPLPGLPMPSSIDAAIRVTNGTATHTGPLADVTIDGWTRVALTVPAPPSGPAYRSFSVVLSGPGSAGFTAYLDDVAVASGVTSQTATFESGTEGYTASGGAVSRSTQAARTGGASLGVAIGASNPTAVTITAPAPSFDPATIEAWVRVGFRAPAPDTGASIAADLHAASVSRVKPFVLGELGIEAAVPGLTKCAAKPTTAVRASTISSVIATQTDPVYGSDGVVLWDWKDPSIRSTTPGGSLVADPTVDCWTITPGDPAEAVLRAAAAQVPAAPLSAPPALPAFAPRLFAYEGPSGDVGYGTFQRLTLRFTQGGDALAGVRLGATNGCVGSGVTDALGLTSFVCRVNVLGPATITVAPVPSTCGGCSATPATFPVVVKRAVSLTARAQVAERGAPARVHLTIEDPGGASVDGLRWRVPTCGLTGVVSASGARVSIDATCPASVDWNGTKALEASVDGDEATAGVSLAFVGIRFDRVWLDPRTGECVGLSPRAGWAGATTRRGACAGSDTGSFGDWFALQLFGDERDRSMIQSGDALVASIDARDGRRIDGVFAGDAFAATLTRPDGIHPIGSA